MGAYGNAAATEARAVATGSFVIYDLTFFHSPSGVGD